MRKFRRQDPSRNQQSTFPISHPSAWAPKSRVGIESTHPGLCQHVSPVPPLE